MCGIVGLYHADFNKFVNQSLVDALTMLQHRGQDAAGIVTMSTTVDNASRLSHSNLAALGERSSSSSSTTIDADNYHNYKLHLIKDTGTVADVFRQENVTRLLGNIGIGHVRYPTAGGSCSSEAQPFYTNSPFGVSLAHNGNITNTKELKKSLKQDYRHVNTDSDSELLLNYIAAELQRRLRMHKMTPDEVFDAVRAVLRNCRGGYAVVMLINSLGLLAFRDPFGIRPLCFGSRPSATGGTDYAISSESCAINCLGTDFKIDRDVLPGEAIFISLTGQLFTQILHPNPVLSPCLFEYVYFARPDSQIDGVSVYESRINMGAALARKIKLKYPHIDVDVVIPIPETSRTAALECAFTLQKPYREGFQKNRYIARTFIMPGQEMRRKTVRLKLNTIESEFKGKNVLLVDDSIVRGTTSMELVQMARDAGAKKVFFASAAPPVKYPNVYGIDIPTRTELIANKKSVEEIATELRADEVIYNDLEDVVASVTSLNPNIKMMDTSCFDGVYITGDITEKFLNAMEEGRGKGRAGASSTPRNNHHIKDNNKEKNFPPVQQPCDIPVHVHADAYAYPEPVNMTTSPFAIGNGNGKQFNNFPVSSDVQDGGGDDDDYQVGVDIQMGITNNSTSMSNSNYSGFGKANKSKRLSVKTLESANSSTSSLSSHEGEGATPTGGTSCEGLSSYSSSFSNKDGRSNDVNSDFQLHSQKKTKFA